jgi:tetratricopeptide (TPR) repeat protein
VDLATRIQDPGKASLYQTAAALAEARAGNFVEAQRHARSALDLSKDRDNVYFSAIALALSGDAPRARELADGLARRFPEDTLVQHNYAPTMRALVALNVGNPQKALDELEVARPYDRAMPGTGLFGYFGSLYSIDARGKALLAAHRPAEAAGEFQKIVDNRGIALADPVSSLAHLQQARAFVQAGENGKAKAAYQKFLEIWKRADGDLQLMKAAQVEVKELQ